MDALTTHAQCVADDLAAQRATWDNGFTRRRFLTGLGMVGVAALGTQLVTTKAAIAAVPSGNTLINVFLRGGADGLRMLIPASADLGSDYLAAVRPALLPGPDSMIALNGTGGWALNAKFAPLMPLWTSGELAFVPAISNGGISRSHFQAQSFLDNGGQSVSSTGWMDRLLSGLGPGTTFRAVGDGSVLPGSLVGTEKKVALASLEQFSYPSAPKNERRTAAAVESLYRGMSGSLPAAINETVAALRTAAPLKSAGPRNGARYPGGNVGVAFADLAALLHGEVGLQVAAVDVGGWDTHTSEAGQLDQQLTGLVAALAAFMTDLGPARRRRVTVTVTTEFGRRVAQNGALGADHGHGSVMMLLGGGLARSQVAGKWNALSDDTLDAGDVPGLNDPFQVYAELARTRLGVGSTSSVFPGMAASPLGVSRAG